MIESIVKVAISMQVFGISFVITSTQVQGHIEGVDHLTIAGCGV